MLQVRNRNSFEKTGLLLSGGALVSHPVCVFVFFCPLLSVISQSLSPDILDISNQNAYGCWKGLWGSLWHVSGGPGVEASEPLLALCGGRAPVTLTGSPAVHFTFCLPLVAASWQLTCTHDQLWGAPWPGLIDDPLGRGRSWQPVKAQFSGWLAVPELSGFFGERCSQTAASSFWVVMGSFGCSTGQRATTVFPETRLRSDVLRDCVLTSNEFEFSLGPEVWNLAFLWNHNRVKTEVRCTEFSQESSRRSGGTQAEKRYHKLMLSVAAAPLGSSFRMSKRFQF